MVELAAADAGDEDVREAVVVDSRRRATPMPYIGHGQARGRGHVLERPVALVAVQREAGRRRLLGPPCAGPGAAVDEQHVLACRRRRSRGRRRRRPSFRAGASCRPQPLSCVKRDRRGVGHVGERDLRDREWPRDPCVRPSSGGLVSYRWLVEDRLCRSRRRPRHTQRRPTPEDDQVPSGHRRSIRRLAGPDRSPVSGAGGSGFMPWLTASRLAVRRAVRWVNYDGLGRVVRRRVLLAVDARSPSTGPLSSGL